MRFIPNGPDIPDELIVARDAGDVVFFCGAGVSQHVARLPGFAALGSKVLESLGAVSDSPARKLLDMANGAERIAGVGGLLATDRVFSLLEREFELTDVRAAVAEAIKPGTGYALDAHQTLLSLATSRSGVTRLVTTNFDLLFEECAPTLRRFGPPHLPDPRSDREFRGIVHLHGRVDDEYKGPADEEFVVSSPDFGRAYISDGWATRFMRTLLARFQVVFVGYTADDPPMQYLLEALNLHAGNRAKLFAFQSGDRAEARALWEHRGVQAISFDSSGGFGPLWDTLAEWAERARDVEQWHETRLARAAEGPADLSPHERGQIAHILSTPDGAQRALRSPNCLDGTWLLSLDPRQRYANPIPLHDEEDNRFDPFSKLALDGDTPPKPPRRDDVFQKREVPSDAIGPLKVGQLDRTLSDPLAFGELFGNENGTISPLPPRLQTLSRWLAKVAHQPASLWWAAHQVGLHPDTRALIENALLREKDRFSDPVMKGWRFLLASWADRRLRPDEANFRLQDRVKSEGWSASIIREILDIQTPQVTVEPSYHYHPLKENDLNERPISIDVDYPTAHDPVEIDECYLEQAIEQMKYILQLAISLEAEITGDTRLYLPSLGADNERAHGLLGPISAMQKLVARLATKSLQGAQRQVAGWPSHDEYVFARLRIWAASRSFMSPDDTAGLLLDLSDKVFWGSTHRSELLNAMRLRWSELSNEKRNEIEERLRSGSYPWEGVGVEASAELNAHARLDYLYWLSQNEVVLSFDIDAEIFALRAIAPKWETRFGERAAEGNVSRVYGIGIDTDHSRLAQLPPSEILAKAMESEGIDFEARVEREPFKGLSDEKPALALAALTHAGRRGEAPKWAWSTFLRSDRRAEDSLRMLTVVAARLGRLTDKQLSEIAYPLSDWMHRIEGRLYGDASSLFSGLWRIAMRPLKAEPAEVIERPEASWADNALNAPVGRLFDLLHADPAVSDRPAKSGLPAEWQGRVDELLALPGDQRCHAVVLASHNLGWFDRIDPAWAQENLVPMAASHAPDGDAFWDGVVWSGGNGLNERLLSTLLPDLKRLATHPRGRRRDDSIVPGLILNAWGISVERPASERLITDGELRDILVQSDQTFAHEVIRYLEIWSRESRRWQDHIVTFFQNVWPKQRALRTSATSARLAHLLFSSGDLVPKLTTFIVPRLVPLRGGWVNYIPSEEEDRNPAKLYPASVLEIMWAVLGEDASEWPHGALQSLDALERSPETRDDTRLAELRRRQS